MKDKLVLGPGENFYGENWLHIDQADLDHIDVVQDLAEDPSIPAPDNHFDKAVALNVLEHLPHSSYVEIVQELGRVTKPGKEVVISGPHYLSWNCPASDHFRGFSRISMNVFCQNHEYETPYGQPFKEIKKIEYTWNKDVRVKLLRKLLSDFTVSKHIPNTVEEVKFYLEVRSQNLSRVDRFRVDS